MVFYGVHYAILPKQSQAMKIMRSSSLHRVVLPAFIAPTKTATKNNTAFVSSQMLHNAHCLIYLNQDSLWLS